MSFLKKFFGAEAPKWAQPIGNSEFGEFKSDITTTLEANFSDFKVDWEAGSIVIKAPANDKEISEFNLYLHNLVISWKECEPIERKVHTADFVNRVTAGLTTPKVKLRDCLDQIMIRMFDHAFAKVMACVVYKEIGEYLLAGLIIDHGHTVVSVTKEQFEESDMTKEELFEIARKNLKEQDEPHVDVREGELGRLTILTSEIYGASQIMMLEQHTEPDATYWVSIPIRDVLLLVKPHEYSADTLYKVLTTAGRFSDSSPNHYILPVVLEYRNGEFKDLCRVDESNTVYLLPQNERQ